MIMEKAALRKNIETIFEYFQHEVEALESSLIDFCRSCEDMHAHKALSRLLSMSKLKGMSQAALAASQDDLDMPVYYASTIFLHDTFMQLGRGPEEDGRFITGIRIKTNHLTLDRLLSFRFSLKSMVALKGDQDSVNRVLIYLHNRNHKLHATVHIHPGEGAGATAPSHTDDAFHSRLEQGNYPAVGIIFSRSGHFRFFSHKRLFKVSIYGKGVEAINESEHIYCLTELHKTQNSRISPRKLWRRIC